MILLIWTREEMRLQFSKQNKKCLFLSKTIMQQFIRYVKRDLFLSKAL